MVQKFIRLSLSFAAFGLFAALTTSAQVPYSHNVVLVIDENASYADVIANMPWLTSQGKAYGYATNYKSDNGGSLLDYLWLASGSCESKANCTLPPGTHDFGCSGNGCTKPITDNNIFAILDSQGVSWKVYAQGYAAAGGTVTTPDNANGTSYYRRHNAATWYSEVLNNVDGSQSKVVDLSKLATDINDGKLPQYSIIIPDGNNDAHDCPVGLGSCSEAQKLNAADAFLKSNLGPILALSNFQSGGDGLIFVTFDECGDGTDGGCGSSVYAAILGPNVAPHTVSSKSYMHENFLRTMIDALALNSYPGASKTASDMSDFFNDSGKGGQPDVTITQPGNGASVNSTFTLYASASASAGDLITGWYVYVDGKAVYNTGAAGSISPTLSVANGSHSIIARAWESSGTYGDQTINVTVSSLSPVVTVLTPTPGDTQGSPVNFIANASPSPGQSITGWWVYVDGKGQYNAGPTPTLNANMAVPNGAHSIIVRAWDTSGSYSSQTFPLTVSAEPAVTVSSPTPQSNVISPTKVNASATPSAGRSITGWYVYVDGKSVYSAGAVKSISPSVNFSAGMHTLLVRAWDTSGAYGDQTFSVNSATVAVNVSTPFTGASVDSPVEIKASATSNNKITGWGIYVDSNEVFSQNNGKSVDANISMSSGAHTVLVRAWDSTGAYGDQTLALTVE